MVAQQCWPLEEQLLQLLAPSKVSELKVRHLELMVHVIALVEQQGGLVPVGCLSVKVPVRGALEAWGLIQQKHVTWNC